MWQNVSKNVMTHLKCTKKTHMIKRQNFHGPAILELLKKTRKQPVKECAVQDEQ